MSENEQEKTLPNGYQLVKDRVLSRWHVLHDGFFINVNEYDDRTRVFNSEEDACAFCWRHSRGETA